MLSQIGEKFRTFLSNVDSNQGKTGRKRSMNEFDDVQATVKRPRHIDIEVEDAPAAENSLVRVASWVKKKQRSFCDSYYYRKVASSPNILMKKLSRLGRPEEIEATGVSSRPYVNPGLRMEQGPDMHFGSDIIPQMQVHSTPISNPVKGFDFNEAHFNLDQPDRFSFQGSPIEKYQFKAATATVPPRYQDTSQPRYHEGGQALARPPIHSSQYGGNQGNMVRSVPAPGRPAPASNNTTYSSVYDQTYASQHRALPRRRLRGHMQRNKLEAKQSVRMEERRRYADLLQQYTTIPLTGTGFGASSLHRPSTLMSPIIQKDKTLLGTQVTNIGADQSSNISDTTVIEKSQVRPKNDAAGLSDRTFIDLQQISRVRSQRHSLRDETVIDLTESADHVSHSSQSNSRRYESRGSIDTTLKSPITRSQTPKVAPINKSLQDSKYIQENWFQDIHEKFSANSREADRQAREEEIKLKVFKEKREEWEQDLEKKIRYRLHLGERVPGVIEEPYVEEEEEEEEEEEDEFPELTDDQEQMVNAAFKPNPPDQKLVEGFRLELTRRDIQTLRGLSWLNDEVINFYMNLLMERSTLDNRPKVHAFNTFFYPKIIKSGQPSVRRWTKKVDIFTMDYIVVPVHLGMHWCLGVVDFQKKEIRYYDSMGGTNNGCLNALRQYLVDECMEKKKQKYDVSGWKLMNMSDIPQQMNGSDCGMFACKFAEYITRNAAVSFSQEHMPYFRRRMVYEILTKQLM